jgi:hypothetical protein
MYTYGRTPRMLTRHVGLGLNLHHDHRLAIARRWENLVPERLPVRYRKLSSAGSIHLVTLVFGRGNVFEQ